MTTESNADNEDSHCPVSFADDEVVAQNTGRGLSPKDVSFSIASFFTSYAFRARVALARLQRNPSVSPMSSFGVEVIEFDEITNSSTSLKPPLSKCEFDSEQLTSPTSFLHTMVPKSAKQVLRMDLVLLQECPKRSDLKEATWKGCSAGNRAQVWRMLLGYEPLNNADRETILGSKRAEYRELRDILRAPAGVPNLTPSPRAVVEQSTSADLSMHASGAVQKAEDTEQYSELAARTLRQIECDLPRTHPKTPIFHVPEVRNAMRRILYLYGVLHPSKNYVQGMNELLTPILVVSLCNYLSDTEAKGVEGFLSRNTISEQLTTRELEHAEADAFWTFSLLVSLIEDNYMDGHPGIWRRVRRLEEVLAMVDPGLAEHLAQNGNEFIQFSFRWMNCLLMREMPFGLVVRLWDALLAEDDGLSDLHIYVCAALMTSFSRELLTMDFEDAIIFLQRLPTQEWDTSCIDLLLSQAQVWKRSLGLQPLLSQAT